MKYDDQTWHTEGDYPADVPPENSANHIGFFLAWAIEDGLASESLRQSAGASWRAFKERRMSGPEFLRIECDGKLTREELNERGRAFADSYYATDDYLYDYVELFSNLPSVYHAEDSWDNYERVAALLRRSFSEWAGVDYSLDSS